MKDTDAVFEALCRIADRPVPFSQYTSPLLWNDPHISKGMLEAHLDPRHDAASFPTDFIDRAVHWMISRFGISEDSRICDFGCGPGLWTTRFAERGARVTGVDLSERSVRYANEAARRRGLDIRYLCRDYLEFKADGRFDLITMIHGDFSVLSPNQRAGLLETFRELLSETGAVVLDVESMAGYAMIRERRMEHEWYPKGGFMSPEPHHQFNSTYKYDAECLAVDTHTVIEAHRAFELFTWRQCYSVESLKTLFEAHGLKIIEMHADLAGSLFSEDAPRITVVAGRTG